MENYLYVVAQASAPKKEEGPVKGVDDGQPFFGPLQWGGIVLLLVLVVFYVVMKKKGKM